MTITFTVQLELDDLTQPLGEMALDIQDALEAAGFMVNSVAPWAQPTNPQSQMAEAVQGLGV